MNFVLVGAPLSGKGTLGKLLCEYLQIPHISMGDLLRNVANGNSEHSKVVKEELKKGNLLSDDLVIKVLQERLLKSDCKSGFVLDGFPRSLNQALYLDKIVDINQVIYTVVSKETALKRMGLRLICPNCQTGYVLGEHDDLICKKCGHVLQKRADDNENTYNNRIKEFEEVTMPVLNKYNEENKVITIYNEGKINDVFNELKGKLNI